MIGTFTFNIQGTEGAILQMLSHGIVSAALFLCVGVVYDRIHTREIARYGGLGDRMPAYAFVFLFFTMASMGLPGTSGFVGEFMVLVGAFKVSFWVSLLGSTGMILGAVYALWLYRRIIFGSITRDDLRSILDLSAREGRDLRAAGRVDALDGHLPEQLHAVPRRERYCHGRRSSHRPRRGAPARRGGTVTARCVRDR